jgi:hypothetical protein
VAYDTPAEVWTYILSIFEFQSHVHAINERMALSTTKKGSMPVSKYVTKMKSLVDEIASSGKRLDDEMLVSYILAGLDSNVYNVISYVSARVKPITMLELYRQVLFHEECWELPQTSEYHVANVAARGGHGGFGCGHGNDRDCGRGDFGRGNGG